MKEVVNPLSDTQALPWSSDRLLIIDLEDHPSIRGASFSPQANDWILGLPILFTERAAGSSRRR